MRKTQKLFLITLSIFLLCGCGRIPKLKNGEEAVVTLKGGEKISADDLYKELKKNYALGATVNLIDTKILEKEFKKDLDKAKKYADSTIKSMKESYGGEEELLQAIQYYTGYSTIDAYKEYVYINYLQNKATEEYAKTTVSDDDVEKYYKDNYFGDISINHILITPKVSAADQQSGNTSDAEEKAKNKALEVIEKLKKAEKDGKDVKEEFSKLAKEYSNDDATKNIGGALGYINLNKLDSNYDELVNKAVKLKNGKYSTDVITTELGYHVIFRVDQKKKKSLEKAENEIRGILSKDVLSSDQTIAAKAMQYYRKKYDVKIIDSDIDKQYSKYMNSLLNKDKEQNSNNKKDGNK